MVIQRSSYIAGCVCVCHQTPNIDACNAADFQPVLAGRLCRRDIYIRRTIEHCTAIFITHQAACPDILSGIFYGQGTGYMAVVNHCSAAALLAVFRVCLADQGADGHFILRVNIHINLGQIYIAHNGIGTEDRKQTDNCLIRCRCICLLFASQCQTGNGVSIAVKCAIKWCAIVADRIPIGAGNINIRTQRYIAAGIIIFIHRFCKFLQLLCRRNHIRMRLRAIARCKERQVNRIAFCFFQCGINRTENALTTVCRTGNRVKVCSLLFDNSIHQNSRLIPIRLRIRMRNNINFCYCIIFHRYRQRDQAIIALRRTFIGAVFIRTLSNIDSKRRCCHACRQAETHCQCT